MKINSAQIADLDFAKGGGLLPAIVQDARSGAILMQGYMNAEALDKTFASSKVTFFSRSRSELWTKGETSGNFLHFISAHKDCDDDSLLIHAIPDGPTCHEGTLTCFGELENLPFLSYLQELIHSRKDADPESSYTASLFGKGVDKIAQKVGEEAVELVIEAKNEDAEKFLGEASDLLYHYLVLLSQKEHDLNDVIEVLRERHG